MITCDICKGSGVNNDERCFQCGGHGKLRLPCYFCEGAGIKRQTVKENVIVPRGVYDGITLRLSGKGNQSTPDVIVGDLIIKIKVKPHHHF